MSLTLMQKRYIWLAGSHPDKIVVQGRGKRTRKLLYAIDGEELVLFGYSNPMQWLVHRDLFRPLQAYSTFTLTGAGEDIFLRMQTNGDAWTIKDQVEECRVKPRSDMVA